MLDTDVVINLHNFAFPLSSHRHPSVGFFPDHTCFGDIGPQTLFLAGKTTVASQLLSIHRRCLSPTRAPQTSQSDALGPGHILAWPLSLRYRPKCLAGPWAPAAFLEPTTSLCSSVPWATWLLFNALNVPCSFHWDYLFKEASLPRTLSSPGHALCFSFTTLITPAITHFVVCVVECLPPTRISV